MKQFHRKHSYEEIVKIQIIGTVKDFGNAVTILLITLLNDKRQKYPMFSLLAIGLPIKHSSSMKQRSL